MSGTAVDVSSLDKQNGVTLGRILGRGNVGQAEEGPGGKMTATIRIPEDELVYDPAVLVVPHGGTLELTLINDDKNTHCAVLPSNGDTMFIWLVNHSKGTATLELDGPGCSRNSTGARPTPRRSSARSAATPTCSSRSCCRTAPRTRPISTPS